MPLFLYFLCFEKDSFAASFPYKRFFTSLEKKKKEELTTKNVHPHPNTTLDYKEDERDIPAEPKQETKSRICLDLVLLQLSQNLLTLGLGRREVADHVEGTLGKAVTLTA